MEEKSKILKKIITSFAINLIVLIIMGTAAFYFLVPKIKKQAQLLRDKQTEIAIFQGRENGKLNLENDFEKTKQDLPKIVNAIPPKTNLTNFMGDLEKISPSLSIRFDEKSSSLDTVSFEIKLSGDMINLVNFIKKLENLPYCIKITGFEITPSNSTIKAVLWVLT